MILCVPIIIIISISLQFLSLAGQLHLPLWSVNLNWVCHPSACLVLLLRLVDTLISHKVAIGWLPNPNRQ